MCHGTESTHAPGLVHSEGYTQEGIAHSVCVREWKRRRERKKRGEGWRERRGGGLQFSGCRASSMYPGPGTLTFKKGFVGL